MCCVAVAVVVSLKAVAMTGASEAAVDLLWSITGTTNESSVAGDEKAIYRKYISFILCCTGVHIALLWELVGAVRKLRDLMESADQSSTGI